MSRNKRTIIKNCNYLKNSQKRLKDVFDVVFSCPDAIMTEDAAYVGKKRYMTYGQVKAEAEKFASGIYRKIGCVGKYIGLYAENKPQWFVMFWGILLSGNYPYLINLRQPFSFSEEMLRELGAEHIVYLNDKPQTVLNCIDFDDLVQGEECTVPDVAFGDFFALSTSGTTLKKKICIYSGKEIVAQILNADELLKANQLLIHGKRRKEPPKQLVFLPLYHIFGLEAVFLWYTIWQSTFVFPPDMSPDHILHAIRDCGVSHIYAVPLFWDAIVKSVKKQVSKDDALKSKLERGLKLSLRIQNVFPLIGKGFARRAFREVRNALFGDSVRFCISGGSYIKKETLEFINALGYPLVNGYGMTELGITSVETSGRVRNRIGGSIGKPVKTVSYVIDDNGHLCVKGESVCKEMIIDGEHISLTDYFDTGDIMESDEKGHFFAMGRFSDIVFSADGENLNPDFAEQMFSISYANRFVVMGDENNEHLILIVELPRDISEEQKALLNDELEKGYSLLPAAYKIYRTYFTYDRLAGENAIKVSRSYVRKALNEGNIKLYDDMSVCDLRDGADTDDSALKCELRAIIADILNIPEADIGGNAHFMNELGGSSLDYFAFLGKIDEVYGVTLDFEPENFKYSLNDFERILSERLV